MSTTESGLLSRRTFLKGAVALAASASLGSLLAACSPNGTEAASTASSSSVSTSSSSVEPSSSSSATEEEAQAAGSGELAGPVLVAYYSAQGHTEAVAQAIADEVGADLFTITPVEPYSDADLNYNDESSRVSVEHENPDDRAVALATVTPDGFADYATVFVGYPIWWGDAAWPIDQFVSENDFSGKTVIPFCTSASSPLGSSGANLQEMAGTGTWQEGMRFSGGADASEVQEWLQGMES